MTLQDRSSTALAREAAVYYRRGGADREAIERHVLEPLGRFAEMKALVVMTWLGPLIKDEPRDSAEAVAAEIARRRDEKAARP